MLVSLFAGWVMKKDVLEKELTNGGEEKFGLFNFWFILVKYVNPIAIFFVAIAGIVSITQTSLMIFGLVLIAALAIFSKKLA
jgi:NSS family neurotransmitter:Na+ symporter